MLLQWAISAAWGCSFVEGARLAPQPSDDVVAPQAPLLGSVTVRRGRGPQVLGCQPQDTGTVATVVSSSCDDLGQLELRLDRPPGDSDTNQTVGYWFAVAGGAPPEGLAITPGASPADALLGPQIYLSWVDGATDEQEPFELDLEVIPVDAAGNVGESLIVAVSHAGSAAGEAPCSGDTSGCATAPAAPRGGAALVIALLWARRRCIRAVTARSRPRA